MIQYKLHYNLQYNNCPCGEICLAANKNITNIKSSQHCILIYIVMKNRRTNSVSITNKHMHAHTNHTHTHTHTYTVTRPSHCNYLKGT